MKTLIFVFTFCSYLAFAQSDVPGQYPEVSKKLLTLTKVQDLDEATLKLMRNEIFARYGYIFNNADLKAHFTAQSWYKPVSADVTAKLTDIEKKNTELIKRQEERIRTTGDFDAFYAIFLKALEKNNIDKMVFLSHTDLMGGTDDFPRANFRLNWDKIKAAVDDPSNLVHDEVGGSLTYETRMDGDQAEFIEFQKIGACWYVTRFDSAG